MFKPPGGLSCCLLKGGDSAVVDSLLFVATIVCGRVVA